MSHIKIENNEDNHLVKQEQFEEEIYAAIPSGDHQLNFLAQNDYQMANNSDIMENLTDYSENLKASSKRARKQKNKSPSAHKVDIKAKLERSRQSARECRARKKLRYQYLEDLVGRRETANLHLKKEIEQVPMSLLRSYLLC